MLFYRLTEQSYTCNYWFQQSKGKGKYDSYNCQTGNPRVDWDDVLSQSYRRVLPWEMRTPVCNFWMSCFEMVLQESLDDIITQFIRGGKRLQHQCFWFLKMVSQARHDPCYSILQSGAVGRKKEACSAAVEISATLCWTEEVIIHPWVEPWAMLFFVNPPFFLPPSSSEIICRHLNIWTCIVMKEFAYLISETAAQFLFNMSKVSIQYLIALFRVLLSLSSYF